MQGSKPRFNVVSALLWVLVATFCAFHMASARAQSIQQFTGRVTDSSGALIPDAIVTVHNQATGESFKVPTTHAGDYTVPYLKPGIYTITAEAGGFEKTSKTDITLNVDQTSTINFALQVGSQATTITVSASAQQIEFSKADRGEIIDAERIQEMPLNGRNPLNLFGLSPGTLNTENPIYPRPFDNTNKHLYANGAATIVAVNIDGVTDDNQYGLNGYVPAVDSVQEFKVVLNPYDASYGRAGSGAIDLALKSGTNKLHGDVYEYARRAWLDANTWQNNYNKITKPVHTRDQYGFELDGPLIIPRIHSGNNKTFFLIQYEQMNESLPSASGTVTSIPDPAWLTGDFSNATYFNSQTHSLQPLLIYDPLSPLQPVVDPVDGKTKTAHSQFPGNKIPAGRMDPVGQTIAQLYSGITPNVTAGAGFAPYQNNHYWLVVENDIWRNALVKIDYNIGANDKLTARWGAQGRWANENLTGIPLSSPAAYPDNTTNPRFQTGALEWIHVFNARMTLDNKATLMTGMEGARYGNFGNYMSQLGFAGPFTSQLTPASDNHFPYITASGFISLGSASQGFEDLTHTLAYQPNITVVHGQHTMRAGFDMRLEQYDNPNGQAENTLGFTTNFSQHYYNFSEAPGYSSGNAIASLLLGYPNSGTVSVPLGTC